VGDTVRVFVLGVDKETRRISLGMKQLEADPWVSVAEKYHVGDLVTGTVTRLVTFGAFIRLENALEGLVHISELSHEHVRAVEDVLAPGQTIKAKIIKIITDEQKIGLSLKAVAPYGDDALQTSTSEVAISEEAAV
jgi:small subunit ribosomal protein S1